MDAVWTALEGSRPCRSKEYIANGENKNLGKKILDWMTLQVVNYDYARPPKRHV